MTVRAILLFAAVATYPLAAAAQDLVDPVACRATEDVSSAIPVTHAGRTYHVMDAMCRDAFLAEPERYAQLFDALAELESEGRTPVRKPETASLVPS